MQPTLLNFFKAHGDRLKPAIPSARKPSAEETVYSGKSEVDHESNEVNAKETTNFGDFDKYECPAELKQGQGGLDTVSVPNEEERAAVKHGESKAESAQSIKSVKVEKVASERPPKKENKEPLTKDESEIADCELIVDMENEEHTGNTEVDSKKESLKCNDRMGLSAYEYKRKQNMRRNDEFLSSLGLDSVKPKSLGSPSVSKPTSSKRKRPLATSESRNTVPTRRSSRVANGPEKKLEYLDTIARDDLEMEDDTTEEAEELYDDESVFRYVVGQTSKTTTRLDGQSNEVGNHAAKRAIPVQGLSLAHTNPLYCPDLAAIYSLNVHPQYNNIIIASGKGGYCSLFDTNAANSIEPEAGASSIGMISVFKAHDRWVSVSKFLSRPLSNNSSDSDKRMPILTSSDDGSVKLWDLGRCRSGEERKDQALYKKPLLLSRSTSALHSRGIFALDEENREILTGSKDFSICHSRILDSTSQISLLSHFNLHNKVVKTVEWCRDSDHANAPNLFASGSQDRSVCIKDIRIGSASDVCSPDLKISQAHDGGVHTISWSQNVGVPSDGFKLLTAGMDPFIKVYDLRMLRSKEETSPLFVFRGHSNPRLTRFKEIVTPRFLTADSIISPGEGSDCLSIYCTKTGKTISRGELPARPMAVAVANNHQGAQGTKAISVVAACKGGTLYRINVF